MARGGRTYRVRAVRGSVWHQKQQRGARGNTDGGLIGPAKLEEISEEGPTPIVPKNGGIPIKNQFVLNDDLKAMLGGELTGHVKYAVPAKTLLNHLFPPNSLPVTVDEVYEKLKERVMADNPTYTERNWWSKWLEFLGLPETYDQYLAKMEEEEAAEFNGDGEENGITDDDEVIFDDDSDDDDDYLEDSDMEDMASRPATREEQLCFIFQSVCDAASEECPELKEEVDRVWTAYFHKKPLKSDVSHIISKPDMCCLNAGVRIKDFKDKKNPNRARWKIIHIIGEEKEKPKSEKQFIKQVAPGIYTKGYLLIENQANRRFALSKVVTGDVARISSMDRGGVVHSAGFNMKKSPKLFLHSLLGLTFAPDAYIGIDPNIEVAENGDRYLILRGQRYKIDKVVWRTAMIRGRATTCYIVTSGDKEFIIKDYWIVVGREPTEVFFLREADRYGIEGVLELWDWENVMVNGKLDTADNIRGVYRPLINRLHRRLIMTNPAETLSNFRSKREFISVLRDIVATHRDLVRKARILHRDISIFNIMIQRTIHTDGLGKDMRKGLLIDYDYALDLAPETREEGTSVDSPSVWPNRQYANTSPEIKKKAGRKSLPQTLVPDFEELESTGISEGLDEGEVEMQKMMLEEFERGIRIRGHRTGTFPFMANEILSFKQTAHTDKHDLESIFYVFIYGCVVYLGPNDYQRPEEFFPEFLRDWIYPKSSANLGCTKLGMLNFPVHHFKEAITANFTRYMKDLEPYAIEMKEALRTGDITHERWLEIFDKALKELPVDEEPFVPNIVKDIPGVNESARGRLRKYKREQKKFLAGYVTADADFISSKGADDLRLSVEDLQSNDDVADDVTIVAEFLDEYEEKEKELMMEDEDITEAIPIDQLHISENADVLEEANGEDETATHAPIAESDLQQTTNTGSSTIDPDSVKPRNTRDPVRNPARKRTNTLAGESVPKVPDPKTPKKGRSKKGAVKNAVDSTMKVSVHTNVIGGDGDISLHTTTETLISGEGGRIVLSSEAKANNGSSDVQLKAEAHSSPSSPRSVDKALDAFNTSAERCEEGHPSSQAPAPGDSMALRRNPLRNVRKSSDASATNVGGRPSSANAGSGTRGRPPSANAGPSTRGRPPSANAGPVTRSRFPPINAGPGDGGPSSSSTADVKASGDKSSTAARGGAPSRGSGPVRGSSKPPGGRGRGGRGRGGHVTDFNKGGAKASTTITNLNEATKWDGTQSWYEHFDERPIAKCSEATYTTGL